MKILTEYVGAYFASQLKLEHFNSAKGNGATRDGQVLLPLFLSKLLSWYAGTTSVNLQLVLPSFIPCVENFDNTGSKQVLPKSSGF